MTLTNLLRLTILAGITVALCQPGCRQVCSNKPVAQQVVDARFANDNSIPSIDRLGVFPIENGVEDMQGSEIRIHRQLVAELGRTGAFEVVDAGPSTSGGCDMNLIARGEYPIGILAAGWRRHRCQAIVFARITHYRGYPPLSFGISLYVIDTYDARLLANVNHQWSLDDPSVRADYLNYVKQSYPACREPRIYLSSPSTFTEFVLRRVSQSLTRF